MEARRWKTEGRSRKEMKNDEWKMMNQALTLD
jgi:hypothetical protein